jgi:Taurine catabolism dioxygenase TauD, TfdA family
MNTERGEIVDNRATGALKSSLTGLRRKAVDLSGANPVEVSTPEPGRLLPLVIRPAAEPDTVDLAQWAKNNREQIDNYLSQYGAILFRGFNLNTIPDFENVAAAVYPLYGGYGDLPRAGVSEKIYKSTPYPDDKWILFHNESSHLHRWPLRISFFCVQPSEQGGETPIVDCREVYKQMDPRILRRFEEQGLVYLRNFAEGLDVPWQDFFHTSDKAAVEESCSKDHVECEWTPSGGLRLRQRTRAVVKHPRTGEPVFFNQIQLHHTSCVDPEVRASLQSLFREEDLPRNVYYGDGSPIEDSVVEETLELYKRLAVSLPWQRGDIMMLDNMLTAHARKPHVGARRIVVAMGIMVEYDSI